MLLLCGVSEKILSRAAEDARAISQQESAQLAALLWLYEIVMAPPSSSSFRDSSAAQQERSLQTVQQLCSIYQALLGRVDDVRAHLPLLSRLFGPLVASGGGAESSRQASHSNFHYSSSGGSVRNPIVRARLAEVYSALCRHPSAQALELGESAKALNALVCLEEGSVLGGRDYDKCMPLPVPRAGSLCLLSAGAETGPTGSSCWSPSAPLPR